MGLLCCRVSSEASSKVWSTQVAWWVIFSSTSWFFSGFLAFCCFDSPSPIQFTCQSGCRPALASRVSLMSFLILAPVWGPWHLIISTVLVLILKSLSVLATTTASFLVLSTSSDVPWSDITAKVLCPASRTSLEISFFTASLTLTACLSNSRVCCLVLGQI